MTNRVVFPPPWWIEAWLRGEPKPSVLFVPVKPQPPTYVEHIRVVYAPGTGATKGYQRWSFTGLIEKTPHRVPFNPGDTLLCKETWFVDEWRYEYVYKADDDGTGITPWHGPASMPREAVRITPRVVSVAAVWMPKTSDADARATGVVPARLYSDMYREMHRHSEHLCALHDAWENRYGKRYPWDTWAWRIGVECDS